MFGVGVIGDGVAGDFVVGESDLDCVVHDNGVFCGLTCFFEDHLICLEVHVVLIILKEKTSGVLKFHHLFICWFFGSDVDGLGGEFEFGIFSFYAGVEDVLGIGILRIDVEIVMNVLVSLIVHHFFGVVPEKEQDVDHSKEIEAESVAVSHKRILAPF